jgi:hypothetical protein
VTDQAGSSLVELLVAATVTVLATSVVASAVLGPLRALSDVTEPDERAATFDSAGEVVARVVRSARPSATSPAVVSASPSDLMLRLEDDGDEVLVLLSLQGGDLTLTVVDDARPLHRFPQGVLLDGLDLAASRFVLLDATGVLMPPIDARDVRAVGVVLESDPHATVRITHLRLRNAHEGVRP